MLDSLLTSTATSGSQSLSALLLAVVTAIISGFVISLLYMKTSGKVYSSHLVTTLVFLPAVISVVIMMVGDNVAGAFSLAGLFTIIRFRSAPGSSRDILFILFCVGAGLAYGLGLYGQGLLFTLIMAGLLLVLTKVWFAAASHALYLKIVAPDDMSDNTTFAKILDTFCSSYELEKIGTKDLGSVYEFMYRVTLRDDTKRKSLIDEIRCHNGNMNVSLTNGANAYEF